MLKNSETTVIKRSQIRFNPINPKRHTDRAIKLQEKNLKKVGFLGGIVWNKTTAHLIDGQRRIMALDLYNKYDGTDNDYEVKVEVVELDEQTEKEQLTYMAAGNTKPDIDLIAKYIGDIEPVKYQDLGFDDNQIRDLLSITDSQPIIEEPLEDIIYDSTEARKENVKTVKERVNAIAEEREKKENAFITLSFSSYEAFISFMDIMGISPDERFVKGENVLKLIE